MENYNEQLGKLYKAFFNEVQGNVNEILSVFNDAEIYDKYGQKYYSVDIEGILYSVYENMIYCSEYKSTNNCAMYLSLIDAGYNELRMPLDIDFVAKSFDCEMKEKLIKKILEEDAKRR